MGARPFSSSQFPISPAGELLAERVELDARRRERKRIPIILVCLLLGVLGSYLQVLSEPTSYLAAARVRINFNKQGFGRGRFKLALRDETTTLSSAPFHSLVFHQLAPRVRTKVAGLALRPDNVPSAGKSRQSFDLNPEKLARRTEQSGTRAVGKLSVKLVEGTNLLEFSYRSKDPSVAIEVVNAAAQVAQQANFRVDQLRNERADAFFQGKLASLHDDIVQLQAQQGDEDKLEEGNGPAELVLRQRAAVRNAGNANSLRRRRKLRRQGTPATPGSVFEFQEDSEDIELEELAKSSTRARLDTRLAEARLRLLKSLQAQNQSRNQSQTGPATQGDTDSSRTWLGVGNGSPGQLYAFQSLQLRLEEAEDTYAGLTATLGDRQPAVLSTLAVIRQVKADLAALDQREVEAAQHTVDLSQQRQNTIDRALAQRKALTAQALEKEVQNALIELNLAVDLAVYADTLQALQTDRIYAGLRSPVFELVDPASLPLKPIERPFSLDLSFGALFGLAVGLCIVLALHFRNRRLWSATQAEQASGMGLAGAVPAVPKSTSLHGASAQAAGSDYDVALRDLSGNILWLAGFEAAQVVVVTSAIASEGTSTVAAGCAAALAQSGARVVLLDAHLQRPAISRRFAPATRFGLAHILSGHATLAQAIQPAAGHPGLHLLAAGPVPPRASEVLQTIATVDLLSDLRRQYDYIVIDTAPTLLSTDSAFLAQYADLLLLVARFGRVDLDLLRRANARLRNSDVLCSGLVLNALTAS